MKHVQLVTLDSSIETAIARHPTYREAMRQDDWPRMAELVQSLIGPTLTAVPLSVDELRWGGYFAVDENTREVVGSCAFKSAPSDEGEVEIAYFTYPGFEGRGYATEMARKLVQLATGVREVQRVIAHTLPEANASTRVLTKVGMSFAGEVIDPQDGRVWRWQLESK